MLRGGTCDSEPSSLSQYGLDIQERPAAGLCAIHNFNREHDSDIMALDGNGEHIDYEFLYRGGIRKMERMGEDDPEAAHMRDNIAEEMWVDYLSHLSLQEYPPEKLFSTIYSM